MTESHVCLNDDASGLVHNECPAFSVQYHPEQAWPASTYLFDEFAELMDTFHEKVA